MKIVFFGSDDFALTHLEKLHASVHQIVACVTQPDRPKGRGMNVIFSPIKEFALKHQLDYLQPVDWKSAEVIDQLKSYQADLFVVIAYGRILPQRVLDIPRIFSINVHGSLLPKYRGAAPINWVVINGDSQTGLTIIKMNARMDAGEIIATKQVDILDIDNAKTLRERMMKVGADFLVNVVDAIANNQYQLTAQDETQVTFAEKMSKNLAKIDWTTSALSIHNLVRGLIPWPSAFTDFNGKSLKIYQTKIVDSISSERVGTVVDISKQGFVVQTGDGALLIETVHLENSKPMPAHAFVIGHHLEKGFCFS